MSYDYSLVQSWTPLLNTTAANSSTYPLYKEHVNAFEND